jgi:flagellar assembly factor FliW
MVHRSAVAVEPEESARLAALPGTAMLPVLTFESGLPGFSHLRRFEIVPLEGELAPFCRMRSLEDPQVAFVVVPPGVFFDDYTIQVDEESAERLGVDDPSQVAVLVIVTLAAPPAVPTANLLGPIVVNRRTWAAMQVVQLRSSFPVAAPLPRRS